MISIKRAKFLSRLKQTGATHYWEGCDGTRLIDRIGSYHGTIFNNVKGGQRVYGRGQRSAMFDGVSDFATVADDASIQLVNPWSAELWVKANDKPALTGAMIVSANATADRVRIVMRKPGSVWLVETTVEYSAVSYVRRSGAITTGKWFQFGMVFAGANPDVYIDGVLSNGAATGGAITAGTTWQIGRRSSGDNYFSGMCNIAIFPGVTRTATQFKESYLLQRRVVGGLK